MKCVFLLEPVGSAEYARKAILIVVALVTLTRRRDNLNAFIAPSLLHDDQLWGGAGWDEDNFC
jgi:hypothetical protein